MENFTEELEKYFKETPREKVLDDWEKSNEWDKVGPTVEEFIQHVEDNMEDINEFLKNT